MILGAAGYGFWQWRQINEENKQTKQVASPTRNSVVVIDPTPRLIAPLEFTIPDQPYRMIVSYHNTTHVYEMKPGPNTFSMGDVKIDLPPTAEHPWPVDPYRSVTRSGMMMLYFNLNGMPTPDVAEKINPQFQYAMLSPNYLRPDRFHIPEVDYVVELYHDGQISSKFVNANAPHPQLSIGPYEFCLDPQCAASWPVPPRLYFDDKTMAPHFFFNLDQAEAQYFLDQNAGKTLLDPVVHSNLRTKPKPALVSTTATPPSTVRLSGRELYDRCKGSVAVLRTSDGSQGSGFIGPDRMLITNAHVVSGAEWIDVHFPGGEKFRAKKFRGVSALWDLAAIKLPDSITLPELPVGGTANIGDTVYALGTPRGMEFTLSRGVISQKRRVLNNIEMIQTDASVSPGSSGGPLINEMGQVIGVTSMGSNAALQANNLNFAVSDLMVTQFLKSNREESDHDLNRTTYDTQRLVTAVGSSSADAPEPAGSPLPNTKSVTSSDHNVTVQLPKGWMAIKGKTPLNLVYANQDGKPIVAAQLFVAPVLTRDLDEFYRQRMELFGYLSDDVIRAIKSCETVQVSGVPAKRTTYTRGENTILLEFLLIKSGQGYSFLFLVQADEYHQLERQLDQLVKTAAIR